MTLVEFDTSDKLKNYWDRESASGTAGLHSGWVPSRVKPKPLKLVFTASLLDAQH